MSSLLQLFISFFTIGLFGYGGGYAILSFLQQETERHGWITSERFVDMIAISQSTPGPIAINMATFTGYQVAGVTGALLSSVAVVLPGMGLMIFLAAFFYHFYDRPLAQAIFRGLRPAVVGLVGAAAFQIAAVSVLNLERFRQCGCLFSIFDWRAMAITLVCGGLIYRYRTHPLLLIAGSAVAGILLF